MNRFHILVVDDHALFRRGVISSLKGYRPHWTFSEAENGQEALFTIEKEKSIQLVLLDVAMPVMDGHETVGRLKQTHPDLPVVMLTQFDETCLILHLLQLGINGYLLKNTDPDKVVEAIEAVLNTGKYVNEPMIKALKASIGVTPDRKVRFDLSPRDKEIINYLSRGMATKEIADKMHLSETSIESYRKDLLRKTHTHNVAELISLAHRTGLLTLGSESRVSQNSDAVE